MNVLEKENLTKYEVHLKIDNLNVEDMFDRNRTEELLDIFRFVDKTQGKTRPRYYTISNTFYQAPDQAFPFLSFYLQKEVMEKRDGLVRHFSSIRRRTRRSFASETERR